MQFATVELDPLTVRIDRVEGLGFRGFMMHDMIQGLGC